jgi:hypothetical protein
VGCLYPEHIYLMSATVCGGDLYVLSVGRVVCSFA